MDKTQFPTIGPGPRFESTSQREIEILYVVVVEMLVKQKRYIRSQAEPTEKALEILDTLEALRNRLWPPGCCLPSV